MNATPILCTSIGALGLFASVTILSAGPLDPPVGPVAPTFKTLTEVEPRIAINPTNTPGDNDSTASLFKITQPGSYYLTANITGAVGKHGIEITASGVTLDLNGFDLNGVPGSFSGVNVTVDNLVNIAVVNGSVRAWGVGGIDLTSGRSCRVEGVLASRNTATGIRAGVGSTITNCSASFNTGGGIGTGDGSTITNCAAYLNGGDGISVGNGSTITNCSASQNTGSGIRASSSSTVSNCSASQNARSGIVCASACVIRDNTCSGNGNGGDGAGIHATSERNRIEGNNCTGADRGIDVDIAGNIIIRNTCANNTNNWAVVAGNFLLVVNAPAAAAVNGNSGGTSLGSFDPNANFTY